MNVFFGSEASAEGEKGERTSDMACHDLLMSELSRSSSRASSSLDMRGVVSLFDAMLGGEKERKIKKKPGQGRKCEVQDEERASELGMRTDSHPVSSRRTNIIDGMCRYVTGAFGGERTVLVCSRECDRSRWP